MHEWALAEAIISAVSQIVEKEGLKEVIEVKIKLGELQQIETEVLEFALSQTKTQIFKNAKFNIETTKAQLKCRVCGNEWPFEKEKVDAEAAEAIHFVPETIHAFVKCPSCGSSDLEILRGRGIWLEKVKGVRKP
ncbi:MAG: hydrogenase nickel incorporation protein HypA [Nitrososphaerota archaeon]